MRQQDDDKDSGADAAAVGNDTQVVTPERQAHTPGPWGVVRHHHVNDELWLSVNAGTEGGMRPWIAEIKYLTTGEPEQWANAHLIAAAPELLDALKQIVGVANETIDGVGHRYTFDYNSPFGRMARAAIAKAEGAMIGSATVPDAEQADSTRRSAAPKLPQGGSQ